MVEAMTNINTPPHWKSICLGDCCSIQNGFPFKSEHFSTDEGIPLIRVRSLKAQNCDIYFKGEFDDSFLINDKDILIGMDGDFQPCSWSGGNALLNQRVCRLVDFDERLDRDFAFHAIKEPLKKIQEITFYTTVKHISSSKILEIEIPLPPLPEQRAISHVLHAMQQSREIRLHEIALERERKAALMEHLFTHGTKAEPTKQTEIGEMPKSWEIKTLGSVSEITSGGTPSRSEASYWNGKIPWVKTGEIDYNVILETEEKITEEGLRNSAAKIIPSGTPLIAMYGQGITRGKAAILGIDATLNQACAAILIHSCIDAYFLLHYLKYSYARIRNFGHGANQKNLNSALVRSIIIPIPEIYEQKYILNTLNACDAKITALEHEAHLLDELFRAMLEELMTGRLSVKGLDGSESMKIEDT